MLCLFISLYDDCCYLRQTSYIVTAFATAEEYHLEALANEAQNYGYNVVKLPEGMHSFLWQRVLYDLANF